MESSSSDSSDEEFSTVAEEVEENGVKETVLVAAKKVKAIVLPCIARASCLLALAELAS